MSNIIKQLEQEQLKQNVPSFRPGDTLEVKVWVVEGSIVVKRKGAVRKAKLYYLRALSGKAARIKERLGE